MAYKPISGVLPQFARNAGGAAASGYFLKGYEAGTTTPLSMGVDATPSSTLAKCSLNSRGEPISDANNEDSWFIPHFNEAYVLYLYATEDDADNNITANALWNTGDLSLDFDASDLTITINGLERNLQTYLENKEVPDYATLKANGAAGFYANNDIVYVSYRNVLGDDGGGSFLISSADFSTEVGEDNGEGIYIDIGSGLTAIRREVSELNVLYWGAGDESSDATTAIQNMLDYSRKAFLSADNIPYVKIKFPPRTYTISDSLMLPYGFDATGRPGIDGRIEINGHGAIIKGSGSASNDHDGFVSAYFDGTQNLPTLGTDGESHLAYGITLRGFAIKDCRQALQIQNWNQGCYVSDINCINCQTALFYRRNFYCGFKNIVSRGTPDETGCNITLTGTSGNLTGSLTGATSGVTADVQRVDGSTVYCENFSGWGFSAGETINFSGGGSGTFDSYQAVGNFDFANFTNISALESLRTGDHEIGYKVAGADGNTMYDWGVESSRFGIWTGSASTVMTFITPYIEGCTQAGLYFADGGISRELNIIGGFFNQDTHLVVDADDLPASQYATINFIGTRRLTGDMSLPNNVYGSFLGTPQSSMFNDSSWQDNNTAKIFNMTPEFVFEGAVGNDGAVRLTNWDHRHLKNPGFYNSVFGDRTPTTDTTPYQTVTILPGSSSGEQIQSDTNIDYDLNVMGTWYIQFTDGGGVRYRNYFIMSDGGTAGVPNIYLYRRDGGSGGLNSQEPDSYVTDDGNGKCRFVIDNRAASVSVQTSIIRVF